MAKTMTPEEVRIASDRMAVHEAAREADKPVKGGYFWGVLRLAIGFSFLWAFLDKMFGLGFATGRLDTGVIKFGGADAFVNGGSPTYGFLTFATKGPFKGFFSGLAGATPTTVTWIDWVFMASLLLIGVGLMLGIMTRIAAIGAAGWMVLMYVAGSIWPDNNPFIDEHVLQFVVLLGIAYVGAGRYLGFGNWWRRFGIVRRNPILE
jgi:thiosulfate dehydrogenase (quinone) large subunit